MPKAYVQTTCICLAEAPMIETWQILETYEDEPALLFMMVSRGNEH
jgi:hypothetical protein